MVNIEFLFFPLHGFTSSKTTSRVGVTQSSAHTGEQHTELTAVYSVPGEGVLEHFVKIRGRGG